MPQAPPLPRRSKTLADMRTWALKGCRGGGFTVKTDWCWQKLTKDRKALVWDGPDQPGLKRIVIVATRGRFGAARPAGHLRSQRSPSVNRGDPIPQRQARPLLRARRTAHRQSRPYCDLFARRTRPGWMTVGNGAPPMFPSRPRPEARGPVLRVSLLCRRSGLP